jgi:hypothetical protein
MVPMMVTTEVPQMATRIAMSPRTAGFSNRDYFELNGEIGLHRAARCAVLV